MSSEDEGSKLSDSVTPFIEALSFKVVLPLMPTGPVCALLNKRVPSEGGMKSDGGRREKIVFMVSRCVTNEVGWLSLPVSGVYLRRCAPVVRVLMSSLICVSCSVRTWVVPL